MVIEQLTIFEEIVSRTAAVAMPVTLWILICPLYNTTGIDYAASYE